MKSLKFLIALFFIAAIWACTPGEPAQNTDTTQDAEPTNTEFTLKGEEISYEADSITMKGYLAYNAGSEEKRPGVLVVHEWWGHNAYARKRADMLAELGYVALAVDMYGEGKIAEHPEDAGKFSGALFQDVAGAQARFNAAMEQLKAHPMFDGANTAAIGYCMGGAVVLTMANSGADLDAVAAFHSGVQVPIPAEAGKLEAKVLVCNGAADPFIPAESVIAFKEMMDAAGADYEYIDYEGVKHSFTNPEADSNGIKFNLPLEYNADADQQSWDKMKALFARAFTE